MLTGIASDKDIEACMRHMAEKADGAIFTTYYNPRESSPACSSKSALQAGLWWTVLDSNQ